MHFRFGPTLLVSETSGLVPTSTRLAKVNSLPKNHTGPSIANKLEITRSFIPHNHRPCDWPCVVHKGKHDVYLDPASNQTFGVKPIYLEARSCREPKPEVPVRSSALTWPTRTVRAYFKAGPCAKYQTTSCAGHLSFNPPATARLAIGSV